MYVSQSTCFNAYICIHVTTNLQQATVLVFLACENCYKNYNANVFHWHAGLTLMHVMQSGRMKGQAFIALPSEELAAIVLRDTNGYLLQDRPMVVVSIKLSNHRVGYNIIIIVILIIMSSLVEVSVFSIYTAIWKINESQRQNNYYLD